MSALPLRVHFVGSSGSGKTTCAREAARVLGLPLLPSAARAVMEAEGVTPEAMATDPAVSDRLQPRVFERQLEMENAQPRFVTDRAFDHLGYFAEVGTGAAGVFRSEEFQTYVGRFLNTSEAIVFFARPCRAAWEAAHADPVRRPLLDWDRVTRHDGAVQLMLEAFGVPYVALPDQPLRDRLRTVQAVCGLLARLTR